MDTVERLKLIRERISDPNRVVLDPEHLYETAYGVERWDWPIEESEPERACLMGWTNVLAGDQSSVRRLVREAIYAMDCEGFTGALRSGKVVAVIDYAIADAEARS